jgi:hypothetical protein
MHADELYGLPLERFVPERAALVKTLRADGRRDEAARVARLRKPSVAAWAVNQLVRTQRRDVKALFEAGDNLRKAQDRLLAGRGDAGALRVAAERERAAVDRLVRTARGLLTSEGHELSATIIDRVSETLQAAALDDPARDQVRDGRLERELRHVGLGLGELSGAKPAPRRPQGRAPRAKPATAAAAKRRESAGEARADSQRVARERARAAAAARRRVERATREVRSAEARRDKAARTLEEADQALARARQEEQEAAEALRRGAVDM